MKLRKKESSMIITVTDPATGRQWTVDPRRDLNPRQVRKLHTFPDILVQYAHYVRDRLRAEGIADPIITVDWQCSLNGAPPRRLVDPKVNFAAVERSIWPAPWILRDGHEREGPETVRAGG
jgi:vitamin K-dependent gamma-carboxylase